MVRRQMERVKQTTARGAGEMSSQIERGITNPPTRLLPPAIAALSLIAMTVLHVAVPIATVVQPPFSYGGALLLATGAARRAARRTARSALRVCSESFEEIRDVAHD